MIYIRTDKLKQNLIIVSILLIGVVLLGRVVNKSVASYQERLTCKAFQNQKDAQKAFDTGKYSFLDRDRDGIPCESLTR